MPARSSFIQPKQTDTSSSPGIWQSLIQSHIAWLGPVLHLLAVNRLAANASHGSLDSTRLLAHSLDGELDDALKLRIESLLAKLTSQACWDTLWQTWLNDHGERLSAFLTCTKHPAETPLLAKAASRLMLDTADHMNNQAEMIEPLVQILRDGDPVLAPKAALNLNRIKKQPAMNQLCALWAASRSPVLTKLLQENKFIASEPPDIRVLSALQNNDLEGLFTCTEELIPALIGAANDQDPAIAERAVTCLTNLQNPGAIHVFCLQWLTKRQDLLDRILEEAHYISPEPDRARLYTALKNQRLDLARQILPQQIPDLLSACEDQDPTIRQQALAAAKSLTHKKTILEFCRNAIERESPLVNEIVREGGYLPLEPENQALVLFLTGQWQKYDRLDFEYRLMRTVYSGSKLDLRQRILRHIQSAGKSAYLSILSGSDLRVQSADINDLESETLLHILASNNDWQRLWRLVFETSLVHGIEILKILGQNHWEPATEPERSTFFQLRDCTLQPLVTDTKTLEQILPAAVQSEILRVRGRVNSVAFSPTAPLLAIGTGQGKVVLWNYRAGKIEQILKGFQHSIGLVTFDRTGRLVCAQRSTQSETCRIYINSANHIQPIGRHEGSITSLHVYNQDQVISTGRDQNLCLWDIRSGSLIQSRQLNFWPRFSAVSPDYQQIALITDQLSLVSLPDLKPQPDRFLRARRSGINRSICRTCLFSQDGSSLFVGQTNGQLIAYTRPGKGSLTWKSRLITRCHREMIGLAFQPTHSLLIAAARDNLIRFFRWPEGTLKDQVSNNEGTLTSLHISPDHHFIATGTSESVVTLWDLRALDLPALFIQPVQQATPGQLAALIGLLNTAIFTSPLRSALEFLRIVLEFRFRYDIQVSEIPMMRAGEFDIIVDEYES